LLPLARQAFNKTYKTYTLLFLAPLFIRLITY
jgi:hypothetical protein